MPATTRTGNGDGSGTEATADPHPTPQGDEPNVTDHLDLALAVARDQGMAASELMGLLFYYAHSIAEGYRQDVLRELEAES